MDNNILAQIFRNPIGGTSVSDRFYDDLDKTNISDGTPNYMQQGNLLGTLLKIPAYPVLNLMARYGATDNEALGNPIQEIIDSPNWWVQGGPTPPTNPHIMKYEDLNKARTQSGLLPMDRNEYVSNYLPEGYGFPPEYITQPRQLNPDEQRWLETNPYLEGFGYHSSQDGLNLPAFGGRTLDPKAFQPYNFEQKYQVTEGPTTIR